MKIKTAELFGQALSREVHKLAYPNEPIKEGCTAPPYASDWAFAGPIIEREKIQTTPCEGYWEANGIGAGYSDDTFHTGPTPLIAAMRCFVASKLGETVEIPEELK